MKAVPALARAAAGLLLLAIGAVLYYGREAFIPVALATLLALVLSSAVEGLRRLHVPRAVGAVLIVATLLGVFGMAADALVTPARQWLTDAPRVLQSLERRLRPAAGVVHRLQAVTTQAGTLAQAPGSIAKAAALPPPAAEPARSQVNIITATGATLTSFVACMILTVFLLSGGPPMLARMTAALAANLQATQALRIIEALRKELGRYYGTLALINLGLGVATGLAMLGLGLPNPFLWGAMAALLNFIPYVGSATTLAVLTIVALVSFDATSKILAVAGTYLALATLEGQVVQPLLVGRRLELNPILVFLAIWFGGWFWGVAGIAVAIPTLVALKVVGVHSSSRGALLEFLSPTDSSPLQSIRGRVTKAAARPATEPTVR